MFVFVGPFAVVFLAVLFALIGVGVAAALAGFRRGVIPLAVVGIAFAICVGGYTGVDLYLMVMCWTGKGCI
jgi:hypothetical protein